ncbi:MAG: hypothetical protein M1536_07130 [Firmicutes bacterium]|nr:hypothetical protein [Bacillota bacterium]
MESEDRTIKKVPLPTRVRSGYFTDKTFHIESGHESYDIPWESVQLICAGILVESVAGHATAPVGAITRTLRKILMSESADEKPTRYIREVYYLDIFVDGRPQAFRMDSAHFNYKSFLEDVGVISFQNFKRFVAALATKAVNSRFNPSAVELLSKLKPKINKHNNASEFEMECNQERDTLNSQIPGSELNLSDFPGEVLKMKIKKED